MIHDRTDPTLAELADGGDVMVFSIGYRLAPENPYPSGPEDVSPVFFPIYTMIERPKSHETS